MRNLKKILALALALVMSLSLMATANAFTDDDSITDTYETAVTVLSGLKVFQGYDDGSFLPQGAITRAEVAAIIYRIVTGDVADTQVGIYVDYNKFDDVASTSWYAGYVNFCANAEYIKGYDARTFGPNDPVTGYQALAMILRALGYDKNGEFTGTNWQVQTAAVGEQRGITKNITAGTLNVPATREVVAEILFQAILVNKVNYTPAFGYTEDDTSIGYDTFGLEYVTGVVTANEYADLYDTEPLDEGETRLDVNGEDYDIAYSTTLEEMGMAYNVYLANGGRVLAIADAGNTVFETGEGTEIDEDNTGMDVDSAQKFLNFDEDTVYTSDWRIEYVVVFDDSVAAQNFKDTYAGSASSSRVNVSGSTVSVVFPRNADISAWDMARIDDIFSIASRTDADDDATIIDGEVYVGTQAIDDISDDVSYRQFMADYIDTEDNDAAYTESDNGEWLKVIDNDGDGVADYIFLTEFAMAQIERISRDDEYTLTALDARDVDNDVEIEPEDEIAAGDIVTEDELTEGDVVLYTFIDGKYYIDLAEVVTGTVDARGINSKTETMTVDGTDYVQSHIGYSTDSDVYYFDVTQGHTEETYDLYLDHFGYVRLFIESDYDTFMLLTDGWFETDLRDDTFRAMFWDIEAEDEQDIDVVDNDAGFIWAREEGDEETWGNLRGADETYRLVYSDFATNIAGYSVTDDGYDLKSVEDSADRVGYVVREFEPDDLDDQTLVNATEGGYDIQTTTETQYYLVVRSINTRSTSGWNVEDVITWTGYGNVPAEADLNYEDGPVVGYAVTRDARTSGDYYVADVVVFETLAYSDRDTYFVYDANNWANLEYVWGVGYGADDAIMPDRINVDNELADELSNGPIEFYEIFDDGEVNFIGDDETYASKNIYAGEAVTGYDVEGRNYIRVSVYGSSDKYIYDEAPVYYVTYDADGRFGRVFNVEPMDRDDVDPDDKMIIFTDNDGNVEYAISVEASVDDAYGDNDGRDEAGEYIDELYNGVDGLWDRIVASTVVRTYDTARPDVTIDEYDFEWNVSKDLYGTVSSVSIPYSEWSTWADDDVYTVSPADGNSIAIENLTTFTTADKTVAVDLPDLDDNDGNGVAGTQEIVVYSQGDAVGAVTVAFTFNITYLADATGTTLKENGTVLTPGTSDKYDGASTATIESLVGADGKGGYYTHTGDSWEWHFYGGNGDEYTSLGTSVEDITYGIFVVKSADGASDMYYITFGTYALTADDLVDYAEYLKDKGMTVKDIMTKLDTAKNDLTPAEIAEFFALIDTPAADAWEIWDDVFGGAVTYANTIADALVDADYAADDVVFGYIDSDVDTGLVAGTSSSITRESDGSYTVALDSTDGDIIADTLAAVIQAAGIDLSDATFSWTDSNKGTYGPMGWSDWSAQWKDMRDLARAGSIVYDVTITCGTDLTLNMTLVQAE